MVLTADQDFGNGVRATFAADARIDLHVVGGPLSENHPDDLAKATVVIADLGDADETELLALEQAMQQLGNGPPVIAVTQGFDGAVAR
ncbi:MAG: hypothetical protein KGK33_14415, partial [Hyphomicrobiales bacterium]|nr:hypothetical protein [Hyphomicrobiales bacterium]